MRTVASFPEPSAAYIARALLEAVGIPAEVADEHTVGAFWLYSQAVGGVKLRVPPECFEEARSLLAEDRSALLSAAGLEPEEHACPRCGASEVVQPRAHRWSAILSWVFGLPLVFWSRSLRCAGCGNRWRPSGVRLRGEGEAP